MDEHKIRVLVVEDVAMVSEMIQGMLEEMGYTIAGAAFTGEEALLMIPSLRPDVVLMDIAMPGIDGIETTRRIQARYPTPVVMLTAYETTDLVNKASQVGVGAYIVKPPNPREISRAIAIARARFDDMMALRHLNERLRESEARHRAITESANDAIVASDSQGVITFWNQAATAIFGYREEEAVGQPLTILMPERFRAAHTAGLKRFVETREPRVIGSTVELVALSKSQEEFPVALSLSYWEAGGDLFFSAIIRDITERKRAEQTLRQYAADLEERNAELDAFAHTVAHDLKNPLTAITGFSTLILEAAEDGSLSPEQQLEFVHYIEQNATRMRNIIDELLLLAGVRSMKEVQTSVLDMGRIVEEVQYRLDYLVEESGAIITAPAEWPEALGYGPWVEEVWANYISNAIKYGGRPPLIELGADEMDGHIRFWVRDNGAGLSAEERDRLFAPFERLHQVRAEGHGLGLSIVRRIVEKLGGEVGVNSEIGKGSEFYFTLPRKG